GRVSLCYDDEALESRKEHKPKDSAVGMATTMGVELLTEEEYFELQKLGEFDTKRSSWIKTPPEIRKLGGALYCATVASSSGTTARTLTTAAGHSVVRSGFELSR